MNRLILKFFTFKRFTTLNRLFCIKNNYTKETKGASTFNSVNNIKSLLAGGAFFGLCTFCYQGISTKSKSNEEVWPDKLKNYLTVMTFYDQMSLIVAMISAWISVRCPPFVRLTYNHFYKTSIIGAGLICATGLLIRQMPYEKDFRLKHVAWLVHESLLGGFGGTMLFTAGPLLLRLTLYFAGAMTALNLVVLSSPNEDFLRVRGPVSELLGIIICSCSSHWFLPATNVFYSKMQSPLLSVSLYGCLMYGCVFLWFDAIKRIVIAECYSLPETTLDPINITIATKTFASVSNWILENDCRLSSKWTQS